MGPASENAGYVRRPARSRARRLASMGPASENAGYVRPSAKTKTTLAGFNGSSVRERRLWQHPLNTNRFGWWLQWVQRPRTPVMWIDHNGRKRDSGASMGPASENAGYADAGRNNYGSLLASMGPASENAGYASTQWPSMTGSARFNGSSVRERRLCRHLNAYANHDIGFNGSSVRERRLCLMGLGWVFLLRRASMGPASENAGYARIKLVDPRVGRASMGPASENAGYVVRIHGRRPHRPGFNGSSVRERRL